MLGKVRVYESSIVFFLGMKILDGDKQRFSFQGKEAEGHIVQVY